MLRLAGLALVGWVVAAGAQTVEPRSVHISEFGAVPNTGADCGEALRQAVAAALAAGPHSEVVLDAGVYRVAPPQGSGEVVRIHGADSLTLRGQGPETELIVTEPQATCVAVSESISTVIRDFTIDYDPLPFTQGSIVEINPSEGWFALRIDDGFPGLDMPAFAQSPVPFGRWGLIIDPATRCIKAGVADHVMTPEWVAGDEPNVWRLFPMPDQVERMNDMAVGDRYVHMARGGGNAVFLVDSRDCAVERIRVHASPGLAVGLVACDRPRVDGVEILFREGSGRLLTTDADGVHCQQALRGPVIENCLFEGMADDSINIYYYPGVIQEVVSDIEVIIGNSNRVEPGNRIQVFGPTEGLLRGEARVNETESLPDGRIRLRFDQPIPGMMAGVQKGAVQNEAGEPGDSVYNLSRCGRGFIIRNNTFRNHRRHGMMLKAPGGLVEGNTIDGVAGEAIVIGNDADWPEGVVPNDIIIRSNTIRNVGYGRGYGDSPRGAAIKVHTLAKGYQPGQAKLTSWITLEGNQIHNPPGAAVYIGSARDIVVAETLVTFDADAREPRPAPCIQVEHAEGVRISGLDVFNAPPSIQAAVMIEPNVAPGVKGIVLEDITIQSAQPVPTIEDRREAPAAQAAEGVAE